jgi:hypothetical protein
MASTAIVIMGLSSGDSGKLEAAGHTSGHARSEPDKKLEPLLDVVNRPAFVITAMRTSPVGLLHFVAIRTLGHSGREQVVVSTTLVLASLGMSTFWIRHYITPGSRLIRGYTLRQSERGRILWAFGPEIYLLFLEPVLLQPREGSQTRVRGVPFAAALLVIEIRATRGAQTAAIALADYFHRQ